jgi:hypothetical protein
MAQPREQDGALLSLPALSTLTRTVASREAPASLFSNKQAVTKAGRHGLSPRVTLKN